MIDPFYLWSSFRSVSNVYQGGWWRIQTDFIQAVNDISKKLWVKWSREAEKSQEAKDNMQSFFRSKNLIVDNKAIYGTFKNPENYGRFAAARIIVSKDQCLPCREVDEGKCSNGDFKTQDELTEEYYNSVEQFDVDLIDDQRWGAVNAHLTKKPTLKRPKMRQIDGGFQVAPRLISVVVMDYYVPPKEATFVYTISPGNVQTGAGDQIIYNKDQSKPLEWPPTVINEFLIELGIRYGTFTRDQFLAQMSLQEKQTA